MSLSYQLAVTPFRIKDVAKPGTGNPLIRKLQGLMRLSASDIAAVETITIQQRMFEAQADLIGEGEVAKDVVVVLDGFACRYKQRLAGQRQITAYLLPGDVCDIDAADLGPVDHAVGTLSPCLVARIPVQALADLLRQHPNVAQALRLAKHAEVETARAWIVNLGCRLALERVAHLFCELMTRMELAGLAQDGRCPFPLTQNDLAQTLGLSNVHVNRVLQELRRQGLIELKGKSLRLLDLPRLQKLAEFSPTYLRSNSQAHGRIAGVP